MALQLHYDMTTLVGGKMRDLAPPSNHGDIIGTVVAGLARRFPNATDLLDYISVPHGADLDISGDMSVGLRLTVRSAASNQGILEKSIGEAVNTAYSLIIQQDKFTFRIVDSSMGLHDVSTIATTHSGVLDKEILLEGVKRGSDIEIWVNEFKENTLGGVGLTNTGVGKLRIGALFLPSYRLIGGDIEEVWIDDHALSQAEIGVRARLIQGTRRLVKNVWDCPVCGWHYEENEGFMDSRPHQHTMYACPSCLVTGTTTDIRPTLQVVG